MKAITVGAPSVNNAPIVEQLKALLKD